MDKRFGARESSIEIAVELQSDRDRERGCSFAQPEGCGVPTSSIPVRTSSLTRLLACGVLVLVLSSGSGATWHPPPRALERGLDQQAGTSTARGNNNLDSAGLLKSPRPIRLYWDFRKVVFWSPDPLVSFHTRYLT